MYRVSFLDMSETNNIDEQMATLRWLCRVPLTLKQAKQLIEQLSEKDFLESTISGYRSA